MKITYYGHACIGLELQDKHLLFDPFITPNELAQSVDVDQLRPDYILISHGHQDHIADAVRIAKQSEALVISNFEIVQWLSGQGITKAHPLNHGGGRSFDFGYVKYVNAIHSSSFPDGTYAGNPGGFVVRGERKTFYFSGDTALTYDMKLIADEFQVNAAALCLGDNFTMGVDDAVKAAEFVRCETIFGIHYDTFDPIKIDHEVAVQKFQAARKKLHLLPIGESMVI